MARVVAFVPYLVLAIIALFCVAPLSWLVVSAVSTNATLYLRIPDALTLDHLRQVVTTAEFVRPLVNSLIISGSTTLIVGVASALGGYGLARFDFPGRRVLMLGVLMTRLVPVAATIVPLYVLLSELGLVNSYLGVILVLSAYHLPLALWIMKGFVDTVPIDLEEAAWLDGADRITAVRRVVIPLMAPGLGAVAMLTFVESWGDFLTPLVLLASPEYVPMSIALFRAYLGHNVIDWGLLTAVSVVYMAPSLIMYLLLRRHMMRATVAGALQGA